MAQPEHPNFFDRGGSELRTPALGWVLSWAEDRFQQTDAEMNRAARAFVELVFKKHGREVPRSIRSVEVSNGCYLLADDIPILATINGQDVVLVEDKAGSMDHCGQLRRYRARLKKQKKLKKGLMPVNVRMTMGGNLTALKEAGYEVISLRELIEVLAGREGSEVKNALLADFMACLREEQMMDDRYRK